MKQNEIEDKDVRVKMACCPECGNPTVIAIEHSMTKETKKDFMKTVVEYNLDIKTIPLEEYRNSNIDLFCKETCSKK